LLLDVLLVVLVDELVDELVDVLVDEAAGGKRSTSYHKIRQDMNMMKQQAAREVYLAV